MKVSSSVVKRLHERNLDLKDFAKHMADLTDITCKYRPNDFKAISAERRAAKKVREAAKLLREAKKLWKDAHPKRR